MADNEYKPHLTRNWWTGTNADLDAHIELYRNEIDASFDTQSLFRSQGLTEEVDVEGATNTYRIDRLGAAEAKGRSPGEQVDSQRAINEKHLIVVDRMVYTRHTFDYMDDWTAPSIVANVSREQGIVHAKEYDNAHIAQLLHAGKEKAPTSLKNTGNFYDGLWKEMSGFAAMTINKEKAEAIFDTSKEAIADLVKRDLAPDLGEFVFLVSPDWYSLLLDHDKLVQQPFQSDSGTNDLIQRRVSVLHGIRVIETPRLTGQVRTGHPLGTDFDVTSEFAKGQMILFHPRYSLVTVKAREIESNHHDEPKNMCHHLDTYSMYTVGIRRCDASAVIASN